jgi:hypothetical protein
MSERGCKGVINKEKLPSLLALALRAERGGNGSLPDTTGKVVGPPRDLIVQYQRVLAQLWVLNIPDSSGSPHAHAADLEDAKRLLAEQAKLCDEIGPEFAAAISRQHARFWARMMKRCPWCGEANVFHNPESGEETAP